MAYKRRKQWKQWQILFSWGPKSLLMVTAVMKLKDIAPWKKSYDNRRQCIKKQRHHFIDKVLYSQNHVFSTSYVWINSGIVMLGHKESWKLKNWCFWIVVLEKILESPLDCKIKPVNPKGNQSWIFTGKTDAEAPILWPPDAKSQLIGKDPHAGKSKVKRKRGWQRMRLLDSPTQWTWI